MTYLVFFLAAVGTLAAWCGLMAIVDRAHRVIADRDYGQRGGVVADILIFVGAIVVIAAVAGVACGSCIGTAGAQPGQFQPSYHRGPDRECGDPQYGDCDQRQQHRGNFSPGPFDRSPVDIHDNDVCISPNCSGRSESATTTTTGEAR